MISHLTHDELIAALDSTVNELLESAGLQKPPIDAIALAKRLGFHLVWDDGQSSRARLVRLANRQKLGSLSILLKRDPRPERVQWAVAHEIGEYVSPRVFDALGIDPADGPLSIRETLANRFASRLLLPAELFSIEAARVDWDLLDLKHAFQTASHELIARRMLDFDRPTIISIIDQGRLEFRRSNISGRVPPLGPLERECWQRVHATSRKCDCTKNGSTARGWPIHEPNWRREILRLELNDDCVSA